MKSETKFGLKNEGGIYTTSCGTKLSSQQMAETLIEAIEHINNQMVMTKDARKKKRLQEKLRSIKIWIAFHPDVKQFKIDNRLS